MDMNYIERWLEQVLDTRSYQSVFDMLTAQPKALLNMPLEIQDLCLNSQSYKLIELASYKPLSKAQIELIKHKVNQKEYPSIYMNLIGQKELPYEETIKLIDALVELEMGMRLAEKVLRNNNLEILTYCTKTILPFLASCYYLSQFDLNSESVNLLLNTLQNSNIDTNDKGKLQMLLLKSDLSKEHLNKLIKTIDDFKTLFEYKFAEKILQYDLSPNNIEDLIRLGSKTRANKCTYDTGVEVAKLTTKLLALPQTPWSCVLAILSNAKGYTDFLTIRHLISLKSEKGPIPQNVVITALQKGNSEIRTVILKNLKEKQIDTLLNSPILTHNPRIINEMTQYTPLVNRQIPSLLDLISTIENRDTKYECISQILEQVEESSADASFYRNIYQKIKTSSGLPKTGHSYHLLMDWFLKKYPKTPVDILADMFLSTKSAAFRLKLAQIIQDLDQFKTIKFVGLSNDFNKSDKIIEKMCKSILSNQGIGF